MAKQNKTVMYIIIILIVILVAAGVIYLLKKEKFDITNGCPENCSAGIQCNYYKKCMKDYNDQTMCNNMYCGYS